MNNNCTRRSTSHGLARSTRLSIGWLVGAIASSAVASYDGPPMTLYGITNKNVDNVSQLVRIDRETGEATLFRTVNIPGSLVPESMAYHTRRGEFVIVLSGSDFHTPYALLRLDPLTGEEFIEPVSGFPVDLQKLHGIEYCGDTDTLVISCGPTEAHLEDRIAKISIYGEALEFSPPLGVGDIDYLAWPDWKGDLILSDPNGHNGYPRLLSITDPFGTPHFETYSDTPWEPAIGDAAVEPATLSMFAISYDNTGGTLLELVDSEYDIKGPFMTDEQVVGLAFADITCPGDFNHDGIIDAADMAILLGAWTSIGGDLNGDMITDSIDLAILLGSWGPCSVAVPTA